MLAIGFSQAATPATSCAQAAQTVVPADARAAARAHFEAALRHYEAHDHREAIREFELSLAAVPNADIWFDIGRAHEQLGELAEAIECYERYLRDRVDASDAPALRKRIAELRARHDAERAARSERAAPRNGSLAIDASQPGVAVQLDGRALGSAPLERVLEVEPGAHRVAASKPGHAPFLARIDVQPGALSAAYVRLTPLGARDQPKPAHASAWVLAAGGAAALLTGAGLAIAAGSQRNAGDAHAADDLDTASRVSFGAALGLSAGAMLAYVLD